MSQSTPKEEEATARVKHKLAIDMNVSLRGTRANDGWKLSSLRLGIMGPRFEELATSSVARSLPTRSSRRRSHEASSRSALSQAASRSCLDMASKSF